MTSAPWFGAPWSSRWFLMKPFMGGMTFWSALMSPYACTMTSDTPCCAGSNTAQDKADTRRVERRRPVSRRAPWHSGSGGAQSTYAWVGVGVVGGIAGDGDVAELGAALICPKLENRKTVTGKFVS